MRQALSWLITIDSPDEDIRRRGRNLALLALGVGAMALISAATLVLTRDEGLNIPISVLMLFVYLGVLMVARRGYVAAGALIFISTTTLAVVVAALANGSLSVAPFYLTIPVLVASVCMRPWQIWLVAGINAVVLAMTVLALPDDPLRGAVGDQIVIGSALLLGLVALMSFLGARSTSAALRAARRARAEAEEAAQALARINTDLETTVADRTAALQGALDEVRMRADEQALLLAEVEQQRHIIRELGVPVIPISASTLVMPLVGALDSARILQLQEQALRSLERSRARYLVLDITGVPMVDSQVAQGLVMVVQACRLLGAEGMLVGIRPEVAQSIIGLGLNLRDIYTASNLETALGHIARNGAHPSA